MPTSPTLLFLPGTLCDRRVWQACADVLAADWHCVHIDYRDVDTIAGMAARALAAIPGPLVPVGLSMGGIVALEMWRQAPQRVAALALFDTNPGADIPERHARRAGQVQRACDGQFSTVIAHEMAPAYFGTSMPDPRLLQIVADMALEQGPAAFAAQSDALATRADSWPLLPSITAPVLVACGADDQICPCAMQHRIAALLPRVTFTEIPATGHLAPLEQPAACAALLQSWLQVCFPAPAGPVAQPLNRNQEP